MLRRCLPGTLLILAALGLTTLHAQESPAIQERATDRPQPSSGSNAFALVDDIQSTDYPDTTYDQPLRPQFHFSSKRNWLNDPNGMLFDGQLYHLYFQHNPLGTEWGNMTWGHATSPDMIHWSQKKHALIPYRVDGRSGTIFSGTAIIDHQNLLGKQVGDRKTICAFFTFASVPKFYQAMAYSTDGGETFTYWNEGRPIVDNQGFDSGERDPKVFWHEGSKQWIMALWVQQKPGRIRWFTSTNLVDWRFASDLMRDWAFECMDVVFLPLDGDENNVKCVIYDASFDYEIGHFDGSTFHSQSEVQQAARGNFYAAQTFNHAPNNRVVQIGWMRTNHNVAAQFGLPYNQQMAFPYELTLRQVGEQKKLFCYPIHEIGSLVDQTIEKKNFRLVSDKNPLQDIGELDLVDLELEWVENDAATIELQLPRVTLQYDASKKTLRHHGINNRGEAEWMTTLENITPRDGKISMRLLVDRLSIEVFINHGEQFAAYYLHPDHVPKVYSVQASEPLQVSQLTVKKLRSIWPQGK